MTVCLPLEPSIDPLRNGPNVLVGQMSTRRKHVSGKRVLLLPVSSAARPPDSNSGGGAIGATDTTM